MLFRWIYNISIIERDLIRTFILFSNPENSSLFYIKLRSWSVIRKKILIIWFICWLYWIFYIFQKWWFFLRYVRVTSCLINAVKIFVSRLLNGKAVYSFFFLQLIIFISDFSNSFSLRCFLYRSSKCMRRGVNLWKRAVNWGKTYPNDQDPIQFHEKYIK
jgi:hypothetical protein